MSEFIANLVLLFLCCLAFSIFYWQIFRPVIMSRIRFHLFEMRDMARRIAFERGLANTYFYQGLEKFICKTICYVPDISFVSFVWFMIRHSKYISHDEYEQFEKNAPPEFISMRDGTARDAIFIMLLNSPWEVILSFISYPVFWALGKISRAILYRRAETFVDNIAPDDSIILGVSC
jgi:hypothetical protein